MKINRFIICYWKLYIYKYNINDAIIPLKCFFAEIITNKITFIFNY